MKKLLFCAAALAALLFAGSCQKENLEPVENGQTISYTVQLPDVINTKALGDDITNVDDLYYEVWRTSAEKTTVFTDADNRLYHKSVANAFDDSGKATIEFQLINNQNFTVLFWADVPGNGIYTVTDLTNVTVAQNGDANQEKYAAFSGYDFIESDEKLTGRTVELKRAVAQLNIATTPESLTQFDDYITLKQSKVTVNGLSTSFNVATQEAGDISTADYVYALQNVPSGSVTVGADNYTYIAMNYVGFAKKTGSTIDVEYEFTTSEGTISNEIPNVPVKANYRTNIIGNLISSSSSYTVTLDKEWSTNSNSGNIEVINGGIVKNQNGDYEITNEEGFAYAVNKLFVNGGTFYILNNLNMGDYRLGTVTLPNGMTLNLIGEKPVVTRASSTGSTTGITITGLTQPLIAEVEQGASVLFSGITVKDFNGEDNEAALVQNNQGKVVLEECTIIDENGALDTDTELVGGNPPVYYVAQIGETKYESLQEAVNAVKEGETITILMDITDVAVKYERTVGFTLDLNGNTLTSSTHTHMLEFNWNQVAEQTPVTINITNGTLVSGESTMWTIYSEDTDNVKGTFNLKDLTIDHNMPNYGAVVAGIGNTFNAEKVNITTSYGIGFYAAGGTVVMTECSALVSGLHTAPYNRMAFAVCANGKMTINSGTYSTEPIAESDANNQGTTHGSWCGGVMSSGGTLIINDGTFANGNYGDDDLAEYARGLLLADAGADIQINGGTFNALKNVIDVQNSNAKVYITGGSFSSNPCTNDAISVPEGKAPGKGVDGMWTIVNSVAKVGNKEFATIDDAIAKWTNNTTLTLLADVTLSDVVKIKSTEHHILNLSTFTMTAAEGKNAFEIIASGTGSAERFAITIKADADTPGGINAGKKSIIYYKYADGGISTEDRPIIKIEGGVFTASTSSFGTAGIYTIGTAARKCATLNISGGEFNCSINGSSKSKLIITGGLFHYSVGSQGDSTALRLISGGTFKTLGFMTADSNNTKFWFGTSMANSNVGLYINDDNYLVVGGPVITEFGDKFKAKATNATRWSNYLQYSSAAANGLYYTNAEMAIKNHGEANVVLPE